MKQMHKLLMTLGILSAFQLITACGRDWREDLEPVNRASVVVVKCKCETEKTHNPDYYRVRYRILEIWRDESNGQFAYGVGDVIGRLGKFPEPDDYFLLSDPPCPDEAVLFFGFNDDGLCRRMTAFVNDGSAGVGGSVEELKHIIMTTTSSGEKTEVWIRGKPYHGNQ